MCGIWLSLGLNPPKSVISSVAHRGPDGEGWREFPTPAGPLVMAHRRLAVFDTSDAGLQPMSYDSERFWLVYNGEIYNHAELRDELSCLGHEIRSACDSEVLLAAYAEWGDACLDRFNGMFAFVLWDRRKETLFAARDRFGIKPLYYWRSRDGIAFASEIKQFMSLDGFTARLNGAKAHDFLTYGLIDHDAETMFRGVRQIKAGECLGLTIGKGAAAHDPAPRHWYALPEHGAAGMTETDAIEGVRRLFKDSVSLRLRSDIPTGFCLSGGMDSSSIVCTAAQFQPGFATFSACYDGWDGDERVYMDAVNKATNAKSVKVFPAPETLNGLLDRLVHHQDSPFGSTSIFAQWCVFEAARKKGVPVVLGGQGADEQLAGYYPAFAAFQSGLFRRGRWLRLRRELNGVKEKHRIPVGRQIASMINALLPRPALRAAHRLRGIDRPDWLNKDFSSPFPFPLPAMSGLSGLSRAQMSFATLPGLLHYEDRSSMAFGVESRLPFLDYRLVEMLMGLGDRYKIVDGETKWVLRRAMTDVLPESVLRRQDKVAFATPEHQWMAGPSNLLLQQGIEDAVEQFPGLFRGSALRRLADEVQNGRKRFDKALWRVVSFAAWGRVFGVNAS